MAESVASTIIAECVKQGIMTGQEAHVFLNAVHIIYTEWYDKANVDVKEQLGEWGLRGLKNLMSIVSIDTK